MASSMQNYICYCIILASICTVVVIGLKQTTSPTDQISDSLGEEQREECSLPGDRCENVIKVGEILEPGLEGIATSEPQLKQVLLIHRHGDRTPVQLFENDNLRNESFWAFNGYGQLTNKGKKRLYLLGQLVRKRYDQFLSTSVNKNQRISRSSGVLRCIESAQVFLASFLALDLKNSSDSLYLKWADDSTIPLSSLWQPANIQSVPPEIDGMLAESAVCNNLNREYTKINNSAEVNRIFSEYSKEREILRSLLGYDMDYFYEWFWAGSQMEVEKTYFPDKIRPELNAIYERVTMAGNEAFTAYQSTLLSRRLRIGLLISDMLNHMKEIRNAQPDSRDPFKYKKFVHYAAHDLNIVGLLSIFDSWHRFNFRPDYCSNISIELFDDNGKWFVRIFYMPKVSMDDNGISERYELNLRGCRDNNDNRCSLDKFETLMKPYLIDSWKSWMEECGNSFVGFNPYSNGN